MKQRIGSGSCKAKQKKKTQKEQEKGKSLRKNEEGLREMQETMKCNNIHIIGMPGEEEQGIENLFEKVMMGNFPNLRRENSPKSRKHTESQSRGTQIDPLQDTS